MKATVSATLVARGALAKVALKLVRTPDPRAASCNIGRLALLDPELPTSLVNALLTGSGSGNSGSSGSSNDGDKKKKPSPAPDAKANGKKKASPPALPVDVAYADAAKRDRRGPMLRGVFAEGKDTVAPEDGGSPILRCFLDVEWIDGDGDGDDDEGGCGGGDGHRRNPEYDGLGRSVWLAELLLEMNPVRRWGVPSFSPLSF